MSEMNVPKLRFREFEGEWVEKKLGEVAKITMGQSPSSSSYNDKNIGIPLIQGNADCKDRKTVPRIFTTESTKECKINDIIMTVRAPVGAISKSYHNACIGRGVCAITSKDKNDFIYQFLIKYEDKWNRYAQGSTFTAVNSKDVINLKLNLPQKPEQQKIANFLTSIDQKIEQLTKKEKLLVAYKKGIMQKIFSQEIRFRDENGEVYGDWVERKLGEVSECLDNLRKPLNGEERQKIQGDIPYWGANNIMDYINDYIFDETLILLAEDGGNFNDFSTRAIANLSYGKCWVNNHTHILREIINVSINEFLFYSLVHKNITGYISGGTRAKLIKSEMLKIKINLPSLSEQTKIANFLSSIDKKIEQINRQIEESKGFKKGLLQQMFV